MNLQTIETSLKADFLKAENAAKAEAAKLVQKIEAINGKLTAGIGTLVVNVDKVMDEVAKLDLQAVTIIPTVESDASNPIVAVVIASIPGGAAVQNEVIAILNAALPVLKMVAADAPIFEATINGYAAKIVNLLDKGVTAIETILLDIANYKAPQSA